MLSILVGLVIGAGLAGTVGYYTNASFREKVAADLVVVKTELFALTAKASTGVSVAEADFTKAVAAVKSLLAKL